MKLLLTLSSTLLALASCSSSPQVAESAKAEDLGGQLHASVADYLKKDMNDPASYQPVRWGKPVVWTKANEAKEELSLVSTMAELANYSNHKRADSLRAIASNLRTITDTTRVGLLLPHTYRAKNAMGALVIDSTTLLLSPDGKVLTYGEVFNPGLLKLAHKM